MLFARHCAVNPERRFLMGGGRLLDPEDPSRYQHKASGA